jgi:M6 family metalloprotease-like protein
VSSSSTSSSETSLGYYQATNETINLTQYRLGSDTFGMPTAGNGKLLVIPVTFSDYPCLSVCESRRQDIQTTFFGSADQTAWHSVKSYYETSSYGQLNLTGEVTPWYESTLTAQQFAEQAPVGTYANYFDPTWTLLDSAVSWFKTTTGRNLTEYDTDQDGYLDSVYLVYNNPNASNFYYSTPTQRDTFWAYTYWNYNNLGKASLSSPVGMTLVWSSYDFMYEGYGTSTLDAHTYIHELGHALGLDDYYSYTKNDWGAAGRLDMMDYNILDHNAYSKYLLGWAKPYVLDFTKTTTNITLRPFVSSGDFFLLGNQWNGSAYDEYLIFEYYTPTGLNEKDSIAPYPGNNTRGFTVPGVKIYHVDARLGRYDYVSSLNRWNFSGYTDTIISTNTTATILAHSNSSDYSQNPNFRLLHLIEAGGVNTFKTGGFATNQTLFKQGSSFNPTTTHSSFFYQTGGRFNDLSSIGYRVEFTSLSATSMTMSVIQIS